jgi:hypothetical protein
VPSLTTAWSSAMRTLIFFMAYLPGFCPIISEFYLMQ